MATRTKEMSKSATSASFGTSTIASLKEPTFPTQRMSQSVKKTALIAPLPADGFQTRKLRTLHSQWTPVLNKSKNDQIFGERRDLIGHWFNLWTDSQRRRFLDYLLHQCKRVQLYYLQSWFNLRIPLRHADFTQYLPRFISSYIFSFLDPKSMSQAARVCWHWRFLTEQDELWMPKCIRLGWLLPYVPQDKEYGAWKNHYIKCLKTLKIEYHEQNETYGLLGDGQKSKTKKEKEDFVVIKAPTPWLDNDPVAADLQKGFEAMSHDQNPNAPNMRGTISFMQMDKVKRHQRSWTEPARDFEYGLGSTERRGQHRSLKTDTWSSTANKTKKTLSGSLDLETNHDFTAPTLEPGVVSPVRKPVTRRKDLSGGGSHYRLMSSSTNGSKHLVQQERVLLLSSRLPAIQMLLASVRSDVCAVVYEYDSATIERIQEKLIEEIEDKQQVRSLGIFTSGIAEVELTPYDPTNINTLTHPETKHFWETLCSHLLPADNGGRMDVFAPLAATDAGSSLLWQLGRLTDMAFTSPLTTSASSDYAHSGRGEDGTETTSGGRGEDVLGPWQSDQRAEFNPISQYFQVDRLEAWLAMADRVDEAVTSCQQYLRPYFNQTQDQILADMMGELLFSALPTMHSRFEQVAPVLRKALSSLEAQDDVVDPFEYLGRQFMKASGQNSMFNGTDNDDMQETSTPKRRNDTAKRRLALSDSDDIEDEDEVMQSVHLAKVSSSSNMSTASSKHMRRMALKVDYQLGGSGPDRRKTVAQQLVRSEEAYYQQLRVIRDVYYKPLLQALNSNNAIISHHNLKMIFTDINNLVPVSKLLLEELRSRVDAWGPQQCIGDCFVKFQGKLKTFTNFHNNYPNALSIIDKCNEQQPAFRAFLKTHDRSPSAHMKTLTELMLAPTRRIMDYCRLLVALEHWTPDEHTDRPDLARTQVVFKQLRTFGDECKHRLEHEAELLLLQQRIKNCPSLLESNRRLIREQHLTQWEHTANNNNNKQSGIFDHVQDLAMFLFNDALVVTVRSLRHIPYTQRCETKCTYQSSVALDKLLVVDVPDTKYLRYAFTLKTPKRELLCATESYDAKVGFIALLEDAIQAAHEDD